MLLIYPTVSFYMHTWCIFVQSIGDASMKFQLQFLDLIDKVTALMATADIVKLTNKCEELMASDAYQISLFDASFIEKLKKSPYPFIFKIYLLPFVTWFDHSILRELVDFSRNKEAAELIDQFDSHINYDQPIISCSIPEFSQLIIPCLGNNAEFIILVTKHFKNKNRLLLQDILNIKKELMRRWQLTSYTIHLIAMHNKYSYFYWLIPRQMLPLIEEKLKQDQQVLWDEGHIIMDLLPGNHLLSKDNHQCIKCKFNLMNLSTEDEIEVCMGLILCKLTYVHSHMFICIMYYTLMQIVTV